MFFYVKNAKGDHVYSDQETKAWDRIKGEVTKAVADTRQAKLVAVEAALEVEMAKGAADLKGTPVEAKAAELKAVLAAEQHELVDASADIKTPIYRCSWDGMAAHVTTLEGVFPALSAVDVVGTDGHGKPYTTRVQTGGIPFAGWPQTDVPPSVPKRPTKEQVAEAVAAEAAILEAQLEIVE